MVVGNSLEAETICGLLRTEGIACHHRQTDIGAGAGDAVGDGGPREILVLRDDLLTARQLVTTDASPGPAAQGDLRHPAPSEQANARAGSSEAT